jgi:hypothetical protein
MSLQIGLAYGAAIAIGASSALWVVVSRRWRNPREKEQRRRELVNANGRMIEGYVTACENGLIEYSYHWRGVRYEASQDITGLDSVVSLLHAFSQNTAKTAEDSAGAAKNSATLSESHQLPF